MGTKIYNGYMIHVDGIQGLQKFWRDFSIKLEKFRRELFVKNIVELAKRTNGTVEAIYDFLKEQYEEDVVERGFRIPIADFDFRGNFYVLERGKVVALFNFAQSEFDDFLTSHEEISYYGYWKHAELQEVVSCEEWKQRKKDWEEALPVTMIPKYSMLAFPEFKGYPFRRKHLKVRIMKMIPDVESSLFEENRI
ncbi:hypothetical protein [Bacillus litorisediminis]|uniref:hypothetical protein n=1 Tax=Bacillus litorisediminis TaxID=2922713 RepID=UPI001FAD6AEF|nr:hypothetical protein [Bacillus litorisediminis]